MKSISLAVGVPLCLTAAALAQQPAAEFKTPAGLPATLAGFEDEAMFSIYVNEERLGVSTAVWKKDGSYESRMSISLAGQSRSTATKITPDAEGRWVKAVLEAPVGETTVAREGTAGKRAFK